MKDIVIFQDLDGCLGDLGKHASQYLDYEIDNHIRHEQLEEALRNMVRQRSKIPEFELDDHKDIITEFWATIPWTKTGKRLWQIINRLGCEVQILTALPINTQTTVFPGTVEGKLLWCQENLKGANYTGPNVCPSHTKGTYVIPDKKCILIDDHMSNIRDWAEAGGIAIHHKTDHLEPTLNELLRHFP